MAGAGRNREDRDGLFDRGVQRFIGNCDILSGREYILGRPQVESRPSHIIQSHNPNTHSIFPNFSSHLLLLRYGGSAQLGGSSRPGSIASSHPLPTLLQQGLLFLTNSILMPREVLWSVDEELSAV